MRIRVSPSKTLFAMSFLTGSVLFVACGDAGDYEHTGSGASGPTSSGFSTDASAAASSSGFSGSAGGGGGGAPPPPPPLPPPPPPDNSKDAGTDAQQLACADLDQTKPVILYLSADDSNSMASPVHIREMLNQGVAPQSYEVRTYEFLNYYNIAYPAPAYGNLAIFPELEAKGTMGEYDFQIGVRAFDAAPKRRPITVTFVLDTSGSMSGPAIERERAAVQAIAQSLAAGDVVSMVTWNTANNIVMSGHIATGPNDPQIVAAASALEASGGTDLHSGLVRGYELADMHYGTGRLNRVVLISDGGANVGVTSADLIGLKSQDADKEGIYLVGVGAGPAFSYSDSLMDTVTDKGRGAYVYLDNPAEATRMFVDRFDEVMEVAARGVQVELTMPWYFQMHKFYGEEYSTNPEEVEPQHLAPSDAMVFNQVLKACDPAVVNPTDTITVRAKWTTPLTYTPQETEVTITVGNLLAAQKQGLPKAKAIVAFAEALKAPSKQAFSDVSALILAADPTGMDPALKEIAGLIALHPNH